MRGRRWQVSGEALSRPTAQGGVEFCSPLYFVFWRSVLCAAFLGFGVWVAVTTLPLVDSIIVGVAGAAAAVGVFYRLKRARVVVTRDEIHVYGPVRDRIFHPTEIVSADTILVFYSHLRWFVPVMLTLTTHENRRFRVPAVQALVWNGGIFLPRARRRSQNSYPALAALEIVRLLHS